MRKLIITAAALACSFIGHASAQTSIQALSSSAIEASHVFCTGPCKLFTTSLTTGASSGFFMVFDASSVPADGSLTTAPIYCWAWPANTGQGYTWPVGVQTSKGLVAVFSTGANCLTKTGSATAFFSAQVQ